MTQYPSYKKFLEAKMEEFRTEFYGRLIPFRAIDLDDAEKWISQALLEAVEAGIAASKVDELNRRDQTNQINIAYKKGFNAAIVEAEKRAKSWLEK